jgi:hypothetical protein
MSEPPKASSMGLILIVMGALGMVFSVYHLQSARRDFIAQFQPKPFHFCGNEEKVDERTERWLSGKPD